MLTIPRCSVDRNAYNRARYKAIREGTWVPWRHGRSFERRATPTATKSPTSCELHWAAGFLEGEGYCSGWSGSTYYGAGQVQREPLERLQSIFGGSLTLEPERQQHPNGIRSKPMYRWRVAGARARGVMMTLYSLFSPRRKSQIRRTLCKEAAHASA